MTIEGKENKSSEKSLIENGAKVLGGATATVLGFYASGPEGAAIAGASGVVVTEMLISMFHEIQG